MENENRSADGTYVVKKNKKINILAFIGCLFLALVIWTYVMNTKISNNTKIFTVKMEIKGESVLLNDNNYTIFGATETWVKITVQGTNAEINKYSADDFDVYIDVSKINKSGITPINVTVETPSAAMSVISIDPVQTTVYVDEKVYNKVVKLVVDVNEKNVKADAVVELSSDMLHVSGPKTYLDQIVYAKVIVDSVDYAFVDKNGNYKTNYSVAFYDEAENIVQSPYIVCDFTDFLVTVKGEAETTVSEDTPLAPANGATIK